MKGFPHKWLSPADEPVIKPDLWNREPVPAHPSENTIFSVDWIQYYGTRRPLDVCFLSAAIVIRIHFGIQGCIVPIACFPEYDAQTFVFTIAGPCDNHGKKDFYIFTHNWNYIPLVDTALYRLLPAFDSVSDFHRNRKSRQWVDIKPTPGGKEAAMAELLKGGHVQPPPAPKKGPEVRWEMFPALRKV